MTETNMNTSNPYDGERVPGTVGFPLPGVDRAHRRSRDRRAARRRRDRHDRGQGPERVQGLLAHAGEDRGRVPRRRLLHHRRPRPDRRRAATSTSSAAARTSSSPAASTSIRRRSRARSTPSRAWSKRRDRRAASRLRRGRHGGRGRDEGADVIEAAVLPALDGRLATFKRPSASSSSTSCRATPWARCRRTCCGRPTRTFTRSHRDQDAEARGGRDRLMDRAVVEGHEQVRKLAAANPHQRRKDADQPAIDDHHRPGRHLRAEAPECPRRKAAGPPKPRRR